MQNAECRIKSKVAASAAPGKNKSSEKVLRAFLHIPLAFGETVYTFYISICANSLIMPTRNLITNH